MQSWTHQAADLLPHPGRNNSESEHRWQRVAVSEWQAWICTHVVCCAVVDVCSLSTRIPGNNDHTCTATRAAVVRTCPNPHSSCPCRRVNTVCIDRLELRSKSIRMDSGRATAEALISSHSVDDPSPYDRTEIDEVLDLARVPRPIIGWYDSDSGDVTA